MSVNGLLQYLHSVSHVKKDTEIFVQNEMLALQLADWIGFLRLGIGHTPSQEEVDSGTRTALCEFNSLSSSSSLTGSLPRVLLSSQKGFLSPAHVLRRLHEARQLLTLGEGSAPFVALHVVGFPNTMFSWGGCEHAAGVNDYTIVCFPASSRYWLVVYCDANDTYPEKR